MQGFKNKRESIKGWDGARLASWRGLEGLGFHVQLAGGKEGF